MRPRAGTSNRFPATPGQWVAVQCRTVGDSAKDLVERLFAQHRRSLLVFFGRRVRTSSDAADLAQEAYVRMLRVSDPGAIRDPEAYLFTVASNLIRERASRDRRQATAVDIGDDAIQAQLAEPPTADREVDASRRSARLRIVLDRLPPKCRAAVVLQYRDGLTYEQIGERVGVSAHTVKKYLAQALVHCRRHMVELR
jgi:RNA polymerase sigma factor (sigma-70 family)